MNLLSDLIRGLVGFYWLIASVFVSHWFFLLLLILLVDMYRVRSNREFFYSPPRPEQKEIVRDSGGHPLYVSYKPAKSRRFGLRKR